jgi:hypothetical protein
MKTVTAIRSRDTNPSPIPNGPKVETLNMPPII